MINNKFSILRRDLLKDLYQEEKTSTTHIPIYLNKDQEILIGNASEETGENDTYVLNLHEDAAEKLSSYAFDYDFDYTMLEADESGDPIRLKVNHIYIIEK
ncbi:MAG: hypothetical protein ACR2L1_09040 [Pyrinomonadaceae bacterium]